MKRIAYYIALGAVLLTACRPQSDELLSYGQNDEQVFNVAGYNFACEFESFWLAMNENYCIWDFEEEYGMDWDEVYNTYLPQFKALDDTTRAKVTDEELEALYRQFTDSLHDGHMALLVKNLHTGNYIVLRPNMNRVMRERPQTYQNEKQFITNLDTYLTGSLPAQYGIKAYDATDAREMACELMLTTAIRVVNATTAYIALVDANGGPDATNDSIYAAAGRLQTTMIALASVMSAPTQEVYDDIEKIVSQYNTLANNFVHVCKQIGVEMQPIETKLAEESLSVHYALFDGNIAYLRLNEFNLSSYLSNDYSTETGSYYDAYGRSVQRVWHHWFDTIQTLHAAGQLGGVILDVRNNTGGRVSDYEYVVGALLPSGGYSNATIRVKNGTGRLDFAPLSPCVWDTYDKEHEVVNDRPIVVLANSRSISMAENSTWGVQSLDNGYFIGTRTMGALSALNTAPAAYSETYSGAFGVQGQTAIYGYVPKLVCLYGDELRPRESIGFIPDKEVQLDVQLWKSQKRDNQLEAALDYIHSK